MKIATQYDDAKRSKHVETRLRKKLSKLDRIAPVGTKVDAIFSQPSGSKNKVTLSIAEPKALRSSVMSTHEDLYQAIQLASSKLTRIVNRKMDRRHDHSHEKISMIPVRYQPASVPVSSGGEGTNFALDAATIPQYEQARASFYSKMKQQKPISNSSIASILRETADRLRLWSNGKKRSEFYLRAADAVERTSVNIDKLVRSDRSVAFIKGIDRPMVKRIRQVVLEKKLGLLEELRKQTPKRFETLLSVPGIGPKRLRQLYRKLKVETREDLMNAAKEGKIARLFGFGKRIESKILSAPRNELSRAPS